jgi:hypothetical protein
VLSGDPSTIARDFEPYIKTEVDGIAADLMLAPEQRAEFLRETGQIFRDFEVSPSDSQQWMRRYSQTMRAPPAPEVDDQWRRNSMRAMNEKYDNAEAHRRLTRVAAWLLESVQVACTSHAIRPDRNRRNQSPSQLPVFKMLSLHRS